MGPRIGEHAVGAGTHGQVLEAGLAPRGCPVAIEAKPVARPDPLERGSLLAHQPEKMGVMAGVADEVALGFPRP